MILLFALYVYLVSVFIVLLDLYEENESYGALEFFYRKDIDNVQVFAYTPFLNTLAAMFIVVIRFVDFINRR